MTQMLSLSPNLMVENVSQSIDFYKQQLGFELINSVPSDNGIVWAMMRHTNITLMLHEKNNMSAEYPHFANTVPTATLTLYIIVDDVKALYARTDKTIIIKDLHATPYHMQEFALRDNNGYTLVFSQPAKLK